MTNAPTATTSIDQAQADLAEHGVAVLAGALDPTATADVRDRLVRAAERSEARGFPTRNYEFDPDGHNVRVFMLFNLDPVFSELIVHPLAIGGPFLTIRKFAKDPFQVQDLIAMGTFNEAVASMLANAVEGGMNILVSGGTGTGKTTMLNVLSSFVPHDERIVTIEDAAELQLQQDHTITLEARPPNIEGQGEIRIRELVRNALRMRPDRIIVGEVRGAETLDMLQAMNTGHEGSLTTIHANSPRDALSRLETLVLTGGVDLPLRAIREQIASAFDLLIQISRLVDGSRRITNVTEVLRMESDVITLQDIFIAKPPEEDSPAAGRTLALLSPLGCTGLKPHFLEKMAASGVALPPTFFEREDTVVRPTFAAGYSR